MRYRLPRRKDFYRYKYGAAKTAARNLTLTASRGGIRL